MEQFRSSYFSRTIYSASIRNTDAKTTDTAEISGYSEKSFIVQNTLDQNISLQIQGSADNITYVNVGSAATVNTDTNSLIGPNEVNQLLNYFPYIRATITAADTPTEGSVIVYLIAV